MKRTLRLVSLILAVLMLSVCFASCGNTNYAAKNTEYFIGGTGPLEGSTAVYGVSVQRGAQIAIDEINAQGGLNGVRFKFDMKNDDAGVEKAVSGYNALREAGMQLSLGSVTSKSAKAFGDLANEDQILFLTPSASADDVIGTGDYGFRVCFGDPQQGTISADTLAKEYKKLGVIYDTSDPYSAGIFDAFKAEMEKLGKKEGIDYVVKTFDKDNNKDFSTQVGQLQEANCDILYLPFYYTEAALVIKAAKSKGFEVPVFGNDGFDGINGQIKPEDNITVSVKYTTPFDVTSTEEKVAKFVKTYKEKYGEDPTQFAADGYDAVMILFAAMKEAGINDVTMSAADMSSKVKAILTNGTFKYDGLTGNGMSWDKNGSCNKDAKIVDVKF